MTLANRVDLASTFRLHSSPTATKTIYLDFNGHITTRTSWNNHPRIGGVNFETPAFSTDADTTKFSDAELERIQYIWQRVAEDFAPFDVDVTTEDMGEDALANTGGTDQEWGTRAAIGGSNKDWFKGSAGGIAYLNVFGMTSAGPAFVFAKNLGNGNEKHTAEAISHEVGHNLGLCHDGCPPAAYFKGHGGGKTGWAPIMGSSYYKPVTQWSQGEYKGADNKQDDIATIASARNGLRLRPDDFGDTTAHAKPLNGPQINQFGIITTRKDTDCFSFTTGTGIVNISIANATQAWVRDDSDNYSSTLLVGRSPNLDIAASLFAADGTLIATSNPLNGLGASFKRELQAGTYYLMVDGVGFGDPATNGYSDYGSLGGYLVSGSVIEANT
jgi:hypothetical protein